MDTPADTAPHRAAETYRNVCLIQIGDRHTETLGFFLDYFANSEVTLVHRDASPYSYVCYFEQSLGKRFARICQEYDRTSRYDLAVLITSGEERLFYIPLRKRVRQALESLGLGAPVNGLWSLYKNARRSAGGGALAANGRTASVPAPEVLPSPRRSLLPNSRQTIAICHLRQHMAAKCRNLALSPLLEPIPWLLPVVNLPTSKVEARSRSMCCMGLLEERYHQLIPDIARAMPDTVVRLFARRVDASCRALLADLPNVVIAAGEPTDSMMEHVAGSRFLLILDHPESRYRKDRLSGAIPFGLNLAVPMVMSRQLADLYGIRAGVVTYDDVPGPALVQRLASMTDAEYRVIVEELAAERDRIGELARRTFTGFLESR